MGASRLGMTLLLAVGWHIAALQAQEFVQTGPAIRSVLLEEFTGYRLSFAAEAHAVSNAVEQLVPDSVVLVRVHASLFAAPIAPEDPDYRTSWGTALLQHYSAAILPTALINRSAYGSAVLIPRSDWSAASQQMLSLTSPVNIGLRSTFDDASRVLTVDVEVFYTADGPGANDRITVLLKESSVIGPQLVDGMVDDYSHDHMLRAYLTDLWGDEVTTTTAGTFISRSYTMVVPETFEITNCKAVAFIGEYQGEVYQVDEVAAIGGQTSVEGSSVELANDAGPYPVPTASSVFLPLQGITVQGPLEIRDMLGRVISLPVTPAATGGIVVDCSTWPNGQYTYRSGSGPMHRFIVSH